jgi:3-phosphoshikimate 1-carboxyvinyltransferase
MIIRRPKKPITWPEIIQLPVSKSVANRILTLAAWSRTPVNLEGWNLPDDVLHLRTMLESKSVERFAGEGGTVLRFALPYLAFTATEEISVTGSHRLGKRPIWPLIQALRELGARITPASPSMLFPLQIQPAAMDSSVQSVSVAGNESSQFASALALMAPFTPNGLELKFTTEIASRPYLELTLQILRDSGVNWQWQTPSTLFIPNAVIGELPPLEADWSAWHYWNAWMMLIPPTIPTKFPGLSNNSAQGDREFSGSTDFSSHPDLALTYIPLWAAQGKRGNFTGLGTLNAKESNRLDLMVMNLQNLGYEVASNGTDGCELKGGAFKPGKIETGNDHRMAMGFSIFAALGPVELDFPNCISKSYPKFWDELERAGFLLDRS